MIRMSCKAIAICATLSLPVAAAPAFAASTVYFGLDNSDLSGGGVASNSDAAHSAFVGAAGILGTQGFESLALGAVPSSFAIGGVTASFVNTAQNGYSVIASGVNGLYSTFATSGSQYLDSLSDNGSTYYTISFNTPVRALGFYVSDVSDWLNTGGSIPNLKLNLTQVSGGASLDLANGTDPNTIVNGNVSFIGVIDPANAITGFSISSAASIPGADAIGIDNLQVSPVPEPSQAALMLAGILVLGGLQFLRTRTSGHSSHMPG